MTTERKALYRGRADRFSAQAGELNGRYNRLSFARLGLFLAGVAVAIYLISEYPVFGGIFTLLFIVAFVRFVIWHQGIRRRQQHFENLVQINEAELKGLDHDFNSFAAGKAFLDTGHPYTLDLDVFGNYSFFQYVNRGATWLGRDHLAAWLKAPAPVEEIVARQPAVAELSGYLDWRQNFQAHGRACADDPQDLQLLEKWLQSPSFILGRRRLVIALYLAPWWSLIAILLWIFYLPWQAAILFFLPAIWVLRRYLQPVNETHQQTTRAGEILEHYARLISHAEGQSFQSDKLQELVRAFSLNERSASKDIRRLAYIIGQLNVRYNVFAVILNVLGLWDLQWVYRLERWKEQHRDRLPAWFDALGQLEALAGLGNLYHNNPDWSFPVIHEEPVLEAQSLGHPLIPADKRVTNDLHMPVRGHIKLITGSNMAGKSTFLRTVGINIVLAMAGAPVCAGKLALPPLRVYTSMRTQDALHESTSSFYAELKRLKFIIEAVEGGENVFFLLDEILKGTNSRDRHTGAKALIRQLIRSRGGGLIATHDLELGQLEAEAGGAIENLCIEVEIRDGRLFFDYKLKKGVSRSFNATLLMQQMGIRIGEDR